MKKITTKWFAVYFDFESDKFDRQINGIAIMDGTACEPYPQIDTFRVMDDRQEHREC